MQAGPQLFGIGEISKQQDGNLQPSAPEFQAFSEGGNTEAACPTTQGSPSHGLGSMPIAVSLHNGHEGRCWLEVAADRTCVRLDRAWGHFDPGTLARIQRCHRLLVIVVTRQNGRSSLAWRSCWELA